MPCNPDLVLEHETAYKIASDGMTLGCFMDNRHREPGRGRIGGHKLSDYGHDYVKARAIINGGGDRANDVASYAEIFESLIQQCRVA